MVLIQMKYNPRKVGKCFRHFILEGDISNDQEKGCSLLNNIQGANHYKKSSQPKICTVTKKMLCIQFTQQQLMSTLCAKNYYEKQDSHERLILCQRQKIAQMCNWHCKLDYKSFMEKRTLSLENAAFTLDIHGVLSHCVDFE